MKTCTETHCTYPDCTCQIDRISGQRRVLSKQYRLGLRKLLISEIQKAAQKRGTSDKRIAAQLGFTAQAYSRLIHRNGQLCSIDSLLMYLARLGVAVQLRFEDKSSLPAIDEDNPQHRAAG